jgi:hypothetical protein
MNEVAEKLREARELIETLEAQSRTTWGLDADEIERLDRAKALVAAESGNGH